MSEPTCVCGAKWPQADWRYAQQVRKKGGKGGAGSKDAKPPEAPPLEENSEDDASGSALGSSSSEQITWADVIKRANDQGFTVEVKNPSGEVCQPEGLLNSGAAEPAVEMEVSPQEPPEMGTKERKTHEYSALIAAQRDLQRTQRKLQQSAVELEQLQKKVAERQQQIAEQRAQAVKEEQEQLERTKSYQAASLAYHAAVLAALPAPGPVVPAEGAGAGNPSAEPDQRGQRRQREAPEDDVVELRVLWDQAKEAITKIAGRGTAEHQTELQAMVQTLAAVAGQQLELQEAAAKIQRERAEEEAGAQAKQRLLKGKGKGGKPADDGDAQFS